MKPGLPHWTLLAAQASVPEGEDIYLKEHNTECNEEHKARCGVIQLLAPL